jgi:hypothetical protein
MRGSRGTRLGRQIAAKPRSDRLDGQATRHWSPPRV